VKIANISMLDRPSRGGLSSVKRHAVFQGDSIARSASVARFVV
jgi:hypothetical protein